MEEGDGGGRTAKGRVRQTISDKRNLPEGIRRKKATANVRTALVYRKTLATLIDESVGSKARMKETRRLTDWCHHTGYRIYAAWNTDILDCCGGPSKRASPTSMLRLRLLGSV